MPILLSLSAHAGRIWAAGPEGLFLAENGSLTPVPQPHQLPACCLAVEDRLLTGGAPYSVAYSLDQGQSWQASWTDGVEARAVVMLADPQVQTTGVLVAGTEGGGILRSTNRGATWSVCNYGLHNYQVLALAWAPPPPIKAWPAWDVVLAGTEDGVYRSPNGGRGWKRSKGVQGVVLALAVAPDFHSRGVVLAGTEEQGLWRSTDGGHSFALVNGAPQQVNALAASPSGWLLSDAEALWQSADGLTWTRIPDSQATLAFLVTEQGVFAGGENGLKLVQPSTGGLRRTE